MSAFVSLLHDLPIGQSAEVTALAATGAKKKRMQSLGFIPGTKITVLYESPFGTPRAYLIKGTVIALRRTDAQLVTVSCRTA